MPFVDAANDRVKQLKKGDPERVILEFLLNRELVWTMRSPGGKSRNTLHDAESEWRRTESSNEVF